MKTSVITKDTAQRTISKTLIILRSLNTDFIDVAGRLCQAETMSIEPAQCKGSLEKIDGQSKTGTVMITIETIAEITP